MPVPRGIPEVLPQDPNLGEAEEETHVIYENRAGSNNDNPFGPAAPPDIIGPPPGEEPPLHHGGGAARYSNAVEPPVEEPMSPAEEIPETRESETPEESVAVDPVVSAGGTPPGGDAIDKDTGVVSGGGTSHVLPAAPVPAPPMEPGFQKEWRFCTKCNSLFFNGSTDKGNCAAGGTHATEGFNYFLPIGMIDLPYGQNDWRACTKCGALFLNNDLADRGVCPSGGAHLAGGPNFTVPHSLPELPLAQSNWRFCSKCRSMFFDGFDAKGTCPTGGSHLAAGLTFVLPHDVDAPITHTTLFQSRGAAAFALTANVSFQADGSVRYFGEARNSGIDGYDYSSAIVVKSPFGHGVAMFHSGHVDPHPVLGSGVRHDYWDVTYPAAASIFFLEMLWGNLERNVQYTGWFTNVWDDVIGWAIHIVVGYVIGGVASAVIFLGAELVGLIAGPSATSRIIGGTLWLAGPYGMLFAIAADGIANLGHQQRVVREDEYNWANEQVFHGSLPPREQILITDTAGGGGRPFTFPTPGSQISMNFGPDAFQDVRTYSVNGKKYGETFIHELVHACQLFHGMTRLGYISQGLAARVCEAGGVDPYEYPGPYLPYSDFKLEQQAQIIEEWFTGDNNSARGLKAKDPENPYYRYVLDMQLGNFF